MKTFCLSSPRIDLNFRFVYVNSSAGSVKLKKRVDFQVNNLDLTKFLSGPLQADSRPGNKGYYPRSIKWKLNKVLVL